MKQRVRLIVAGRVQGVGFRAATVEAAERIGVRGWVANRSDGRVEIEAHGTPAAIAQFVAWCRTGPRWARVDAVEIEDRSGGDEFAGFTIRHGAN